MRKGGIYEGIVEKIEFPNKGIIHIEEECVKQENEGGTDGGMRTGEDGGAQTGTDGGAQAGEDGGAQTGTDGGAQAGTDGGAQAGEDGGAQTGTDGEAQAGTDGGAQAGEDGGAQTGKDGGAQAGTRVEKVTVKNTIPGQRVRFLVNKKRRGKCEGRLLEVLEPSALECRPSAEVCPHFGSCGGCLYQSLPYEEQLKIKETQVKELLDGVCEPGSYEFEGIEGSPISEGYRNKMEFSFGDEEKDGPMALGMHRRGSFYDVVTTDDCRIVHSDFCRILACSKEYFEDQGVGFYKKMQHTGYLRHLLVRRAMKTGEILIALITTTQMEAEREDELLRGWREQICALKLTGTLAGILHTKNDSLADAVKDEGTEILYGQDFFYEELLGLKFRISPFSFFQTNSLGAEVLYERTREYVGETDGKVVFDLYSGTGTIAQLLAPVAEKVVGVEIVAEAVEAARENARENGLGNCEFIAGDVLKVVDELTDKPDIIVLDPPRDGIHPKAIGKIIDFGVERIVYVSCKPTSLARDLVILQERGYKVEKGCCVDMFPGTANVETVIMMRNCGSKGK